MVTGFSCHADAQEARARGLDGFRFFGYALGHHYIYGEHVPGRTDIWQRYEQAREHMPQSGGGSGIGTPAELRENLKPFADSGVDQVIFVQQSGRTRHEHICEALELFAAEVMPAFKENEAEREGQKAEELAPYIEAAMARKQWLPALADDEIPTVHALGRQIVEAGPSADAAAGENTIAFGRGAIQVPPADPVGGD
jgi:hypothetical protein